MTKRSPPLLVLTGGARPSGQRLAGLVSDKGATGAHDDDGHDQGAIALLEGPLDHHGDQAKGAQGRPGPPPHGQRGGGSAGQQWCRTDLPWGDRKPFNKEWRPDYAEGTSTGAGRGVRRLSRPPLEGDQQTFDPTRAEATLDLSGGDGLQQLPARGGLLIEDLLQLIAGYLAADQAFTDLERCTHSAFVHRRRPSPLAHPR